LPLFQKIVIQDLTIVSGFNRWDIYNQVPDLNKKVYETTFSGGFFVITSFFYQLIVFQINVISF
jgi:hypothetical protein